MSYIPHYPKDYSRPLEEEKPPRIPIRSQLSEILDQLGIVTSSAGQSFVYVNCVGGHNAYNIPVKSSAVRAWLLTRSLSREIPLPSYTQIREAFQSLESRCYSTSARIQMSVRTAWNAVYQRPLPDDDSPDAPHVSPIEPAMVLALDARTGQHAVVTRNDWSIETSRTHFLFDQVQQPLPTPAANADTDHALQPFRKLLRLDQPRYDAAWQTLLAWLLAALRPAQNANFHTYPILNLLGPENSGKSVTAKLLTQLLDPTGTPLHSIPTTERRLHGLAATHHVLAFDDAGKINPEKSHYLSRLSSGITSLHPQLQGMLVRPIILTTTNEKETKHLAHRVVDLELPPNDSPLTQQQVWRQFEEMRPAILGALLTLLSRDFDGARVLCPNRKTKSQKIAESVPEFVAEQGGTWTGTVTELQAALNFPVSTKALGHYLDHTQAFEVIRKKSDKTKTVILTARVRPIPHPQPTDPQSDNHFVTDHFVTGNVAPCAILLETHNNASACYGTAS